MKLRQISLNHFSGRLNFNKKFHFHFHGFMENDLNFNRINEKVISFFIWRETNIYFSKCWFFFVAKTESEIN